MDSAASKENDQLKEMSNKLFELESEVDGHRQAAAKARNEAKDAEAETTRLGKRVAELEDALEVEVGRSDGRKAKEEKELAKLREKLAHAEKEAAALEEKYYKALELEDDFGALKEEHERTKKELEAAQSANKESESARIQELEEELASVEGKLRATEEEKFGLAHELEEHGKKKKPPPPPPPRKKTMELTTESVCTRGILLAPSAPGETPKELCECFVRISGQGITLEAVDPTCEGGKALGKRKDAFSLFELAQFAVNPSAGIFVFEVPGDDGNSAYGISLKSAATAHALQKCTLAYIEEKMAQMDKGMSSESSPPQPQPQPTGSTSDSARDQQMSNTPDTEKKKFSLRRSLGVRGKSKHDT